MSAPATKTVTLAGALWVALGLSVQAQLTAYDPAGARSFSGQFAVHTEPSRPSLGHEPDYSTEPGMLKLEASLLAISCERIKQAAMSELGDKTQWRGKIFLSLHPAQSANDEITFTTERFKDTWGYRLDVPNPVQRTRFVRAVVQALLQERVNRNSRTRSAELPLWLIQGLTETVLASRSLEVVLPPAQWTVNRVTVNPVMFETRRTNSVALALAGLGARGPISLDDLSWPKEDQLSGPDASAFSHSAQLFLGELLQFQDGHECFGAFLDRLPSFLNWQTAFLRGFRPHFERQLDLEKWWALQIVTLTGREPGALWTVVETWKKLEDLVPVQVQVRRVSNEYPVPAQVTLGTVIREWDVVRQVNALNAKLRELNLARSRAAEEFLPLLDEYRLIIQEYLPQAGKQGMKLPGARNTNSLARETAKRLDALDERRKKMRPATMEAPKAEALPAVTQR